MSRRRRRASGRTSTKPASGVRKKTTRAASRVEKKRLQIAARRAAADASKRRAPRRIAVLGAGAASRELCVTFATELEKHGFIARAVGKGLVCALDEALVADSLVILFKNERELDDEAVNQIVAIRAQGLPSVFATTLDEDNNTETRRHRSRVLAAYSLGEETALRTLDLPALVRRITEKAPRDIVWRSRYGYLAVDNAERNSDGMVIGGWLRGMGLDANRLIHVTGLGTFICGKIVDEKSGQVVSVRDAELGEDIAAEVVPDTTMGEQTWITEIEEDGDEFFADGEPDEEESKMMTGEADEGEDETTGLSMEMLMANEIDEEQENDDDKMDVDEDEVKRLREAAKTDAQFPDEVDTPMDQPARERFARYRGLKSFRTSEWDPKEQLPRDYASLFQFQNPKATRKRVLAASAKQAEDKNAPNFARAGSRVRVHLVGVSSNQAEWILRRVNKKQVVVACGLLKHENKHSVVHFGVTRVDEEDDGAAPIKAKTPMICRAGFVCFDGRPMFSEQNSNADKHKMERFLQHGKYTVVSFYGPCVFAPAPVSLFLGDGRMIASGSVLGADPDRIILKRIVLTGYPFQTQKRKSVAKFMFFNADDIRWFKPVELWTKMGRAGHILAPVGTKGHMKCIFDSPLLHHDTVCMTLWKRVYPKKVGDSLTLEEYR